MEVNQARKLANKSGTDFDGWLKINYDCQPTAVPRGYLGEIHERLRKMAEEKSQ
jgi:hypothetical protein